MTDTSRSDEQHFADVARHSIVVGGIDIGYRMAGPRDAPVLLILHGFPGSSATFEPLMRHLGRRWRVIAPDYPGFGHSATPQPEWFEYTFDRLAEVIDGFVTAMRLGSFALYMFDFGAPVGMRLAVRRPDRVTAMISQNGNVYEDGLGPGFNGLRSYWADAATVEPQLRAGLLSPLGVQALHRAGAVHPERIDPALVAQAADQLSDPIRQRVALELLYDYRNNIDQYQSWHGWLREHHPPLLAIWGTHDPIFTADGAHAFTRDVPDAEVVLLEAGHFAALEATTTLANHIDQFLANVLTTEPIGTPLVARHLHDSDPTLRESCFATKPTLTGQHVLLRPVTSFDAIPMADMDAETLRLTGTPRRHSMDELERWYGSRAKHDDRLDLAIVEQASNTVVGEVVLMDLDIENRSCTFRIALLGPEMYGRGLGTEATKLIVGYAFDTVGLHRIELEVYDFNPRARRVYEKVGFVYEGTKRCALRWEDTWVDAHVMSILANEWDGSAT